MFGIGMTELVVILVIALLIFGPNKLPELARSLGKGFGEFRRASYDLRQSLMDVGDLDPPERSQAAPTPPKEAAPTEAPQRTDQAGAPPPPKDSEGDPDPPTST